MWRFLFGAGLGAALTWFLSAGRAAGRDPLNLLRRIQEAATECYFATAPARGNKTERRKVYRHGQMELAEIAAMEGVPLPDELIEKVAALAKTSFDQACKDQEGYFKDASEVLRLIADELEEEEAA